MARWGGMTQGVLFCAPGSRPFGATGQFPISRCVGPYADSVGRFRRRSGTLCICIPSLTPTKLIGVFLPPFLAHFLWRCERPRSIVACRPPKSTGQASPPTTRLASNLAVAPPVLSLSLSVSTGKGSLHSRRLCDRESGRGSHCRCHRRRQLPPPQHRER